MNLVLIDQDEIEAHDRTRKELDMHGFLSVWHKGPPPKYQHSILLFVAGFTSGLIFTLGALGMLW